MEEDSPWVYGPFEVKAPLARLALASKISLVRSCDRIHDIEAIEDKRQSVEDKWLADQGQISQAYIKQVRPWTLKWVF